MTTVAQTLGRPRRRAPLPVLWAIALAWAVALLAELSGNADALHQHGAIAGGPPLWAALLLFLLAWQAMVAAMMLPSSLPLIRLFDVTSRTQERAGLVRASFLSGYVAVWTAFGAAAFLGDLGLHRAVDTVPWLAERPWLVSGAILGFAGVFQFSDLKERCLSKCRHPAPYLYAHYRRGAGAAFRLGGGHGIFCLGCCWALMLVMFALGTAVLWWMAALTALMVYEKIGRHGAGAARVAGVALVAAAAVQIVHPAGLPTALGGSRSFGADVTVRPGTGVRVLRTNGYTIELGLGTQRATRPGVMRLSLARGAHAVSGAKVRASYTMLDMAMGDVRSAIPEAAPGMYVGSGPVLGMAGHWGIRFDIAPPHRPPFSVRVVEQVSP